MSKEVEALKAIFTFSREDPLPHASLGKALFTPHQSAQK